MRRTSPSPFLANPSPFRSARYAYPVFSSSDPFYRSFPDEAVPARSNSFNHSPPSRNPRPSIINVPVFDVSPSPASVDKRPRPAVSVRLDPSSAAIKIQACFRGFSVRHRKPLLHLRTITSARHQLNDLRSQLQSPEFLACLRSSQRERLRFNESVMALLLKLDAVEGAIQEVRLQRKEAIKMAVQLQDSLDVLLQEGKSQSNDSSLVDSGISVADDDMSMAVQNAYNVVNSPLGEDSISGESKLLQNGDILMTDSTAEVEAYNGLLVSSDESAEVRAVVEDMSMADPIVHCAPLKDEVYNTSETNQGQSTSLLVKSVDDECKVGDGSDMISEDANEFQLTCYEMKNCSDAATELDFEGEDQGNVLEEDACQRNAQDEESSETNAQENSAMRLDEGTDKDVIWNATIFVGRTDMETGKQGNDDGASLVGGAVDMETEKRIDDDATEVTEVRVEEQLKTNEQEVDEAEDMRSREHSPEGMSPRQRVDSQSPGNSLADCQDRVVLTSDQVDSGVDDQTLKDGFVVSGIDSQKFEESIECMQTQVPVKTESDDYLLQQLSDDCKQLKSLLGKLLLESSLQNKVIFALGKRLERLEQQQSNNAKKKVKSSNKKEKKN